MRNLGLTLFLAAVGMGAGAPFVQTVAETGLSLLGIGVAIALAAVVSVMALGHLALRMSTDDLFGVVSGVTGNPAILAFSNQALPSDRVDVVYATTYPAMTILKIVSVQVAIGVLGGP